MALKKLGAVVCSIALLSGCNTATQASKQSSSQVEAKDVKKEDSQEEMTLSGRAEPYQEVLVSPVIGGKIKHIYADLGSYVKQGQKLAELDEGDLAVKVKQAENQIRIVEAQGHLTAMEQQIALNQTMASLNQAMAGLNTTTPPESPTLPESPEFLGFPELEAAKTVVKDAELALTEVTQEWAETNELFENGLVSKQELDQVTSAKAKAETELERAKKKVETEAVKADIQQKYEEEKAKYKEEKAKYDQEKAKYDREKAKYEQGKATKAARQTDKSAEDTMKLQKESARVTSQMTKIGIENAKKELETIRSQYNNLPVVAPVNGFITEKKGRIGESVSPQTSLFVITNLDKLYINIDVPEGMINRWKENQTVKVEIPTQGIIVDGKVIYIGLMPSGDKQTYPVKVLIDNVDHKIKGGMKAVVSWKMESGGSQPQ
ncbi:multidrug resistance efflux pump [Bacillus fengqiuensis]|nr:multidrug resistance efflux pump [Bacillus fengqiuensis]